MQKHDARAAIMAAAILSMAVPTWAQPTGTTNRGKPPLAPADSKDRLPDPARKKVDLSKVELGARPDVTISEIQFIGAGVPANVAKAAQKFVGRRASAETLTKLAAAMTKAYERSSVALFTLVIPEQDLSSGIVKVASAEGHVTSVLIAGETEGGAAPLVQKMVAPLPQQRPLSRARFERILGNVEDIPGLDVKSTVQTSGEQGGVILGIELDQKKPTISIGYTSRTNRFVRDGIFEGTARGYSLLRAGDETSINAAASVNFKSLRYLAIGHDTPIGANGTRLGLSAAALETRPVGLNTKGEAWSGGLSVRHPIIRGSRRNLVAGASLDYLNSRNALFGSLVAAETTWISSGYLLFRLNEEKTVLATRVGVSQGLNILDAKVDPAVGNRSFRYAEASIEANRAIGKKSVLRAAALGRWTEDRLPAAQRLSIGGQTFGRAFDDGLVNGDRGYAAFGEFAFRPLASGKMTNSEIYGFADYARVTLLSRPLNPTTSFELGSWGGGLRLAYSDKAAIGVEAAKPWKVPVAGFDNDWRLSVTWKLSLRP